METLNECEYKIREWRKAKGDKIWWADVEAIGVDIFTFDKKTIYYMWADYPHALTPEQKAIFDKENPYWAEFFKDRQ